MMKNKESSAGGANAGLPARRMDRALTSSLGRAEITKRTTGIPELAGGVGSPLKKFGKRTHSGLVRVRRPACGITLQWRLGTGGGAGLPAITGDYRLKKAFCGHQCQPGAR